jgi:formylglycine-generating enzyme required for sulfatase activity
MFSHTTFDERDDKSIDLPRITVPKSDVSADMAFFAGGEFIMGAADFGPLLAPPHHRSADPFYLDKTEVTVAIYKKVRKGLPEGVKNQPPPDNEAIRSVTFDEAVLCAEELGKRLPDEVEYEYAATNGGKNRFPWGNEFERIVSWPFGAVGIPPYDRALANPAVAGLYSNVAEWTSSKHAPYPGVEWAAELRIPFQNHRIVRGGPYAVVKGDADPHGKNLKETWDARFRQSIGRDETHKGLGFRCARSFAPHFPRTSSK